MSEMTAAYAAQITLTLPGHPDTATAIVTLLPADKISVGKETKPLSECTLAELAAYGQALEAEMWDAYEAISLLELREEANLGIRVIALDESGQAANEIEDWSTQLVLLDAAPLKPDGAEAREEEGQAIQAAEAAPIGPAVEEPEKSDSREATLLAEDVPPVTPITPAPTAPLPPTPPTIIPSKARVRVAGGQLPMSESGGAAVDILMDEPPLRAMQAHALSSLDREVAGVMVGHRPEKQPDGRYVVHVIDSIAAKYTVMHGASVTYTPESWRYLNDTLWERYPDESAVMVGWYHTHPGFGIFLSGMDLFIHQNFFTQIWHVAYVLDPRARSSGFFCWNRQKSKVNRYDFLWPDWAAGSW